MITKDIVINKKKVYNRCVDTLDTNCMNQPHQISTVTEIYFWMKHVRNKKKKTIDNFLNVLHFCF